MMKLRRCRIEEDKNCMAAINDAGLRIDLDQAGSQNFCP